MPRLVPLGAIAVLLTACSGTVAPSTTSNGPSPTSTATSAPPSVSTTSLAQHAFEGGVGLYEVDPTTLEAIGATPITTGDWITGNTSKNADWLALSVWISGEPETDLVRVVDLVRREVVAEANVLVPTLPIVADDGTAYWTDGSMAPFLRLYSLTPGSDEAELAFDEFPVGFEALGDPMMLDTNRIGWLGQFGPETEEDATGLVVLDLTESTTTTYLLPEVFAGAGEEVDFGQVKGVEWFSPEVVWDGSRDRAFVVHADQDAFTIVDLSSGTTGTRTWARPSSWLGRLFAWLVPPAQAKGPSLGTIRSVALSPNGETLYVGTTSSNVETEDDTRLSAVWRPDGVVAIDTKTGAISATWEVPASDIYMSPDGDYLVATGMTIRDSVGTSSYDNEGAYIIDLSSGILVRHVAQTDESEGQVQFSAEGDIAYLATYHGKIEVIDLTTGNLIAELHGSQELTVFGQAGLLATRQ